MTQRSPSPSLRDDGDEMARVPRPRGARSGAAAAERKTRSDCSGEDGAYRFAFCNLSALQPSVLTPQPPGCFFP